MRLSDTRYSVIFSVITFVLGCGCLYIGHGDIKGYIWGSILFVLSIVLFIAGIRYSINRKKALELGTYLNAVVKMRQEDTDKPEVSLMISYQLDDKTYTDMLFDRFNSKCPYYRGDIIRVCVYNGRVYYVEEDFNEA